MQLGINVSEGCLPTMRPSGREEEQVPVLGLHRVEEKLGDFLTGEEGGFAAGPARLASPSRGSSSGNNELRLCPRPQEKAVLRRQLFDVSSVPTSYLAGLG